MTFPPLLQSYTLVALGGALGSVARFAMVAALGPRADDGVPLATMAVNIVGSLLIGLIAGLTEHKALQQFLIVGILGGFTTFSAFSLQSLRLIQDERWGFAAFYIVGSVALCVFGTYVGQLLAGVIAPARPA